MDKPEPIDPAIEAALSLNGDVGAIRRYYDEWAPTFDANVGAERYATPAEISRLLAEVIVNDRNEPYEGLSVDLADLDTPILDVGCGTGLIGAALAEQGYTTIDGVDLSPAMIEVAKERDCFRRLIAEVDITAPLPDELVGAYDLVCAGGVLTVGHVPPSALVNIAAMVRPGGLLIITTRRRYYDETDYQTVSDQLEADGLLRLLHRNMDAPYTLDSTGHFWAYAVLR